MFRRILDDFLTICQQPPGPRLGIEALPTLEEVTDKSIADVLGEEIWSKIGADADALIVVNNKGIAASHGGLITTLRDLARFGLVFTPSWQATSRTQIVSDSFLRRITQNGRPTLVKTKFLDHGPHGSTM